MTPRKYRTNKKGDMTTLKSGPLKLVVKFTIIGRSISSTKYNINTRLAMAWTATDRLSVILKSDLTDKIKSSFFQGSGRIDTAIWMHYVDVNYNVWRKSLTVIIQECCDPYWTSPGGNIAQNSSCTRHLLTITKTVQIRQIRHAGDYWRSKDKLINDVLLWTPSHGRAKFGLQLEPYQQ